MKAEYDLSAGKRGAVLSSKGKTRITIWLDDDVLSAFRERAEADNIGYQTLINQALRTSLASAQPLDEGQIRKIIREAMQANQSSAA